MTLESIILYIVTFLYGIVIGSFLNVCIYRMPKKESLVTVGVVGFDGIEMAMYYHPSLTTICQPKEEMARASIKMLLDLIEEHPVKNNQQIFKAELRPGESTQKI